MTRLCSAGATSSSSLTTRSADTGRLSSTPIGDLVTGNLVTAVVSGGGGVSPLRLKTLPSVVLFRGILPIMMLFRSLTDVIETARFIRLQRSIRSSFSCSGIGDLLLQKGNGTMLGSVHVKRNRERRSERHSWGYLDVSIVMDIDRERERELRRLRRRHERKEIKGERERRGRAERLER